MSSPEKGTFEITVADRPYTLEVGKCAVAPFREKQEVDYFAIFIEEEGEEPTIFRVFNNQEFARWIGGYAIELDEDGDLARPTMYMEDDNGMECTFREVVGWNAPVVEKDEPSPWEEDMWVEVNMRDLDEGVNYGGLS